MNNKATIITFHAVLNYGAILQAYGLQEVLKTYFSEVEFLDYRPKSVYNSYKIIETSTIPSFVRSIRSLRTSLRKFKRFNKFISHNLLCSHITADNQESFNNYQTEYMFLGSDQIWNPEITNGFDPVYFGNVGRGNGTVKVAYAASFGKSQFDKEQMEQILHLIKDIDYISVREDAAKALIQLATDEQIDVVVDPTILAGKESFEKHLVPINDKNYVLLFSLARDELNVKHAIKIAKYLGCELIEITNVRQPFIKRNRKIIYDAGPSEFLSYIKNAKYVITDSFHGTVFSILFHRPFSTILHKTRGERMRTLLKGVGLADRLSDKFDKTLLHSEIDWEEVELKIRSLRQESLEYIERTLQHD